MWMLSPWTARVSNVEVLNRMGRQRGMEVLHEIKRQRFEYFCYVLRNGKYRLLQLVMKGKIERRRRSDRRKHLGSKM